MIIAITKTSAVAGCKDSIGDAEICLPNYILYTTCTPPVIPNTLSVQLLPLAMPPPSSNGAKS